MTIVPVITACLSRAAHVITDPECCSLLAGTREQGKGDLLEAPKPVVCQVEALERCVGFQSAANDLDSIPCQVQLCQAYQLAQPCDVTDLVVCKP